ncbi:hypothetical protein QEG73_13770 [Chitinophagaceae bacterium 26-R-25]|nr:hypothetical protein [Chitinophagaceae bacterium 26-R-25]
MHYTSEQEILHLIEQFNTKTLPKSAWTHAAHLTVGLWHVHNFTLDESICRMRSGIVSYNLAVGTENTGDSGYHETLTIFWLTVLYHFLKLEEGKSLLTLCNQLLDSRLAINSLPFFFYDRGRILSTNARARFQEPNKNEVSRPIITRILTNEIDIT